MKCHGHDVKGTVIDHETRCAHYHSKRDIIAIKFYCCGEYYPCYECHEESGCGHPAVWPSEKFDEKAILCGACGHGLSIHDYRNCLYECPACKASFNPGCGLHWELYFEKWAL